MENINLLAVFTTGLLTGGLTCMAVQGGLLAATIAQREEQRLTDVTKQTGHALPITTFLIAKFIAYTLLGLLLGWMGSFFTLSVTVQIILQIMVVFFMLGTALNMLNAHPFFRYFVIQPPRFLTKFIRKQSKRKDVFAPALLGAFTVFIPCGTTQAMMVLAIGTGSPLYGALIMSAFTLGTSPVFFTLGYFAAKLSDIMHQNFMRFAAAAITVLALFNLNNTLSLAGSPITFNNLWESFNCAVSFCSDNLAQASNLKAVESIDIEMSDAGYAPNIFAVKRGSKVSMRLINKSGRGCIQAFTIPQLNIQAVIPVGTEQTVSFTVPDRTGDIAFTCSMGMYPGTIKVI